MKNISIKKIQQQLKDGVTKEEIEKELELNPRERKALWKHPDLKGLRTAKYKVELNFIENDGEILAADEATDQYIERVNEEGF